MNKVILIGRFVRDPEIRYTTNDRCCANFSIAVDRKYKQEGQQDADFPRVIAWGKTAEFIEKYFRQGMKIVIEGRIQTGKYTNKEGQTVYTTDVVAESVEFAESKSASSNSNSSKLAESKPKIDQDGWMNIPDDVDDEGLPFN
ncbi:single-stranded DNA-binding protein [Lachnoanaerobaculum saburreum]|uniref:Single-stranded DNA-binding protein n=1 Tax=Lachnoanaerobaculum saburreum TaxID=467210 RepID=A0A133ZYT5_9FIRM|nr:single-stranded DNA-binding protein [Lachnoanaerobaculum saburreum]KXB60596.1 single-strand binding family protein [Lachnoanaerobaculum saburreum]